MAKVATRKAPAHSPGMRRTEARSLIAAAPSVPIGPALDPSAWKGGTQIGNTEGWQQEAWTFFNCVSELRYVSSWLQNALSRCTLVASDIDPKTGQPTGTTEDAEVQQTVADIAGGPAGQAKLLGQLATFLTVPGEGYVAIILRDGAEEWHVLSTTEVHKDSTGVVKIDLPDGEKHEINDDTDTIARVYRPHPQNAQMADSPVRASLPTLREIVRLGQWVEATAKSRLTGNGIFVIPQEISLPKSQAPTGADQKPDPDAPGLPPIQPSEDEFPEVGSLDGVRFDQSAGPSDVMQALIDAGSVAMENPDTAAATIPVVMQGPGDWLDKMQHITFSTQFTEVVIKLREAATKRLAIGLDVPSEILLGMGDSNHWSAWQIEESAIKLHVEPLLTLVCDAITEYILRPLLELKNHPNPEGVMVWYSTTELVMRPDKSNDARSAFESGVVSAKTYREEIGYGDEHAPKLPTSDQERFELCLQLMDKDSRFAKVAADMAGIELPDPPPQLVNPLGETSGSPGESDTDTGDDSSPLPDTEEDARTDRADRKPAAGLRPVR